MFLRGFHLAIFCLVLFIITIFFVSGCSYPQAAPPTATITPTKEIIIIQNTATYTPTRTPIVMTPTVTPIITPTTADPIFYTVEPGETLSEIAIRFDLSVNDLVRANHLADPNFIYTGQQLLIATVPIVVPEPTSSTGKQIIVVLSTQRTYAFEDGVLVMEFKVGTGKFSTPTVTGSYRIERKYVVTDMSGPGYYIYDVPWTMYFHLGYGFHGADWNPNLHQTSHGCINMHKADAEQLFKWAEVGTPVIVIP